MENIYIVNNDLLHPRETRHVYKKTYAQIYVATSFKMVKTGHNLYAQIHINGETYCDISIKWKSLRQ